VGRAPATGRYFRVVDRGIRCVRAPCFSLLASVVNADKRIALSGIGLGAAPIDIRKRIEAALGTKSGVLARGRIFATEDGGRVLRRVPRLAEDARDRERRHEQQQGDADPLVRPQPQPPLVVRNGEALTPPLDAGLLPGITREFVMEIATEAGVACREARLTPEDLPEVDEAFITGTTREVTPVVAVDARAHGDVGPPLCDL